MQSTRAEQAVTGPRWQFGLGRENGLAFWAMMLLEGSVQAYWIFLPLYVAYLGANPAQVGAIVGVWGILRLVFLAPSGMLIERFPASALIIWSRAANVVGLLFMAALPVWWLLPLPLLFIGAGTIAFPAISKTIAAAAGEERTRAFALVYTVGPGIATVLAPLLAGVVAQVVGLRAILLVAAGFSTASIAIFCVRHTAAERRADDAPTATYREALACAPVRTLTIWQTATLLVLTLGIALVPNYLHDVRGLDFDRIGQLGSVAAIGSIMLGLLFSRLQPLRRPLPGITVAVACTAVSFAILVASGSLPPVALAFLLRGGYNVAWSLYYAAFGEVTPPRLYGRAFVLSEFGGGIGLAVAPFLAGPLYAWQPAAPLAVAFVACLPLLGGLIVLARRQPAVQTPAAPQPQAAD
ncbi:MAG: MFS transporter [Thermomicrobiales bacterium]